MALFYPIRLWFRDWNLELGRRRTDRRAKRMRFSNVPIRPADNLLPASPSDTNYISLVSHHWIVRIVTFECACVLPERGGAGKCKSLMGCWY